MRHDPRRVENYTNAFLMTAGIILFMAFFTIAAIAGIIWVLLSAAFLDGLIRIGHARLRARQIRQRL